MTAENGAFDNSGFVATKEDFSTKNSATNENENKDKSCDALPNNESQTTVTRDRWGSGIEFLMSCIALSVGLGNVWRFPFIALENGGGAFLIPYIIVLFLVGKPVYYLEMILGQFSSRGCVKIFDYAPIMRGIGYGQVMSTFFIATYYASLMALTLRYLILSFYATLPWSYCREEWGPECIDSRLKVGDAAEDQTAVNGSIRKTSAEHYFYKVILHETPNLDDGIGAPDWYLALTLAASWIIIVSIVIRGIKTSGKAAYFLALFPYLIMLVLLVRALTLPGALDGVLYFLRPQWDKLLDASVWYAAVTQVFFSLTICYGIISMYASYNSFDHNINRDCTIVTTLDTFTSLLSGVIIFGILGNLAHETGTTDIKSVVKGGPGLAFISYPDAIAKFAFAPQVFSTLFFLMMFILGVGTNVGVITSVITVACELLPNIPRKHIVITICFTTYCFGLMYVTPGGQYMLNYIDFYGVTFVAIVLAIFELITAGWIYGVKTVCRDIEFMLSVKTSIYYRLCWSIITPAFMAVILIYTLIQYKPLEYNGVKYPAYLYVVGWCISAFGIGQLLIWALIAFNKRPEAKFYDRLRHALRPASSWGPLQPSKLKLYQLTTNKKDVNEPSIVTRTGFWFKAFSALFFLMMFILGVGSNVGVITSVITVACENFPNIPRWRIVIVICSLTYCCGLMYVTPGGQYMLNYIDFYAVTFVAIVLGILELITAGWIYGVKNICRDIEFMLNIKTSLYYRLCWGIITPTLMATILIYTLVDYKPLDYNGVRFPGYFYVIGWCISAFGIGQVLVWGVIAIYKTPETKFCERLKAVFKPSINWGPINPSTINLYKLSKDETECIAGSKPVVKKDFWSQVYDNIFN